MRIQWLGHASMSITTDGGLRIITDPYTPGAFGLNYGPINAEADIVTVSHEHPDHDNVSSVKGKPRVVKGGGSHTVNGVEFLGVNSFHDEQSGSQRGANIIFRFSADGMTLCHLGDLGHPLDPEQQSQIGEIDVLFVPVGGNFTIDAGVAADTCRSLKPRVAIPMHFRNDRCPEFPVAGVEEFLALMSNVRREDGSEVELSKDSLPQEMEVVVLKPAL